MTLEEILRTCLLLPYYFKQMRQLLSMIISILYILVSTLLSIWHLTLSFTLLDFSSILYLIYHLTNDIPSLGFFILHCIFEHHIRTLYSRIIFGYWSVFLVLTYHYWWLFISIYIFHLKTFKICFTYQFTTYILIGINLYGLRLYSLCPILSMYSIIFFSLQT